MSEKRSVPTFRVYLIGQPEPLEGPVLSPNKQSVAENITAIHDVLYAHGAILMHSKQWVYIPNHAVHHVERGMNRFSLPWPLTD